MGTPIALECSRCGCSLEPTKLTSVCSCGGPLLVTYNLAALRGSWTKDSLTAQSADMWRYEPVLPAWRAEAVTLGEGWTPLLKADRLGEAIGASKVWLKDEGRNPTGSFTARGLSAAVTVAKKLGCAKLAISSAGNAAGALAAYAAAAALEARVFMPAGVSQANFLECRAAGAAVTLVNGSISDCARLVEERKERAGWFEVGALKEPYGMEGEKTIGYEIAEQFCWELPEVILYPCGAGVGLIGMWKAFDEMEALGWIGKRRPKMIAVQAAGCAPIVRAFEQNAECAEFWHGAHTVASELRVPKPLGDFLVLRAVRQSGGAAIAVTDEEMLDAGLLLAASEGVFAAPETGACVAALGKLIGQGFLRPDEQAVLFSTGSGFKYLEAWSTRFPRHAASEQDKLGGLITPR